MEKNPFPKSGRTIFVCSPYRGDVTTNTARAACICRYIVSCGDIPIAPHLYAPAFLDDNDPSERELGIELGLELMDFCDEVWVCGDTITAGMAQEIAAAEQRGLPVVRMEQAEGWT